MSHLTNPVQEKVKKANINKILVENSRAVARSLETNEGLLKMCKECKVSVSHAPSLYGITSTCTLT